MISNRRSFLRSLSVGLGIGSLHQDSGIALSSNPVRLKLGFDNFSIRALGWKAPRLLEYAASLELDAILLSDLDVYESLSPGYLKEIRQQARQLGIQLQAGTGSICSSSGTFNDRFGSAEDHLRLGIRVAADLGSPVLRCYLGNSRDRSSPGGIDRHIENTVRVCQRVRDYALDKGVKIAIENHAGDLRASELAGLIQRAGPDFVGATVDSGNALWALEDPLTNLKILGPYALSTGIRDSQVWTSPEGVVVQWAAVGEGDLDFKEYVGLFSRLCPEVPFQLEIISELRRPFPYLEKEFWSQYPDLPASEFSEFLAFARRGGARPPLEIPEGEERARFLMDFQKNQLERSLRYCREVLGLGIRGRS